MVCRPRAFCFCFALCFALLTSLATAQQTTNLPSANPLFGHNLLHNGDAEQETNTMWAPGWEPDGTLQEAAYGRTAGEWEQGIQGAPHGGCCYFRLEWQGQIGSSKSVSQQVDLSSLATQIDAGKVWASLSGYLGGIIQGGTTTSLTITWLDQNGKVVGNSGISAAPLELRHPFVGAASLIPRNQTELIPMGARKGIVRLTGKATGQSYTYTALADNLALMLSESSVSF